MSNVKKYYWVKLDKDFFKRHDIKIIEAMPNGDKYIILYLKLILESTNHGGRLRFSETIPYNEDMIATVTNTDIDVVRSALKLFTELGFMEVYDDMTLFFHETNKMVGVETEWAKKKRIYRDNKKLELDDKRTKKDIVRQEIDKEKELEIDKDINTLVDFDSFWNLYPKKVGKGQAIKTFNKLIKDDETFNLIINDLEKRKQCKNWLENEGKFIPHPSTYLNNMGWLDEYELIKKEIKKEIGNFIIS